MNIAIVDDDVDFSSELQQYVKKFIERLYTRYEIDIINNNFFNNTLDKTYDIVFLDIDLKEINGINIGKKLLVSEANPIIIFVSSRDDLVFSSLSVRPFYFNKVIFKTRFRRNVYFVKDVFKRNNAIIYF